jgi:sulfur-oxidizing protein SoxA
MSFVRTIVVAVLLATAPALLAGEIPRDARRSGYSFMGPDTRAMQDDDTSNPGMLFVLDGKTLWKKKLGSADKACADCHGEARDSMKGVAARYPAFDKALGRPVTLDQRINLCRANHQQAAAALRKPRPARALRLRRPPVTRAGDHRRRRSGAQAVRRAGPRAIHAA